MTQPSPDRSGPSPADVERAVTLLRKELAKPLIAWPAPHATLREALALLLDWHKVVRTCPLSPGGECYGTCDSCTLRRGLTAALVGWAEALTS